MRTGDLGWVLAMNYVAPPTTWQLQNIVLEVLLNRITGEVTAIAASNGLSQMSRNLCEPPPQRKHQLNKLDSPCLCAYGQCARL